MKTVPAKDNSEVLWSFQSIGNIWGHCIHYGGGQWQCDQRHRSHVYYLDTPRYLLSLQTVLPHAGHFQMDFIVTYPITFAMMSLSTHKLTMYIIRGSPTIFGGNLISACCCHIPLRMIYCRVVIYCTVTIDVDSLVINFPHGGNYAKMRKWSYLY